MNFRNFSLPCTRATEVNYRLLKILEVKIKTQKRVVAVAVKQHLKIVIEYHPSFS